MLVRSDQELTKKIYHAQKRDPIKGDWVTIVQEDLNTVKINMDENQFSKSLLENMSKMQLL